MRMKLEMALWPAPSNIIAGCTTRALGNLALHVNDDPKAVLKRREACEALIGGKPHYLNQTHSTIVSVDDNPDADAAYSNQAHRICCVMTADCLPILLCHQAGTEIAAIHAGWRGLLNGIIENTVQCFHDGTHNLLAWLGPAICQQCYEVDDDFKRQFCAADKNAENAFVKGKANKWQCDLKTIASQRLKQLGIHAIFDSGLCTHCDETQFFSYRRDSQTGRQMSFISQT